MPRTLAFVVMAAVLAPAPLHAQHRPDLRDGLGPMGPYISPVATSLSRPVTRDLVGGTLTMVHAPATLHVGTAYIALFVDDAEGRPDADADLSCYLYSPGEPDRGVRVFVWRAEPGRFLLREILLKEQGRRELAVRVIRPNREDQVEYFTLEIDRMPEPECPAELSMHGGRSLLGPDARAFEIPGGRLMIGHSPRPAHVGRIDFELLVQTTRADAISLSAILLRAGVSDFYDLLNLRNHGQGRFVGRAHVPAPGLYLLRVQCIPHGCLPCTVQYELRVGE